MNNGEQSRFITQIEVEGIHSVNKNILISKTPVKQSVEPSYSKTKLVQEKLIDCRKWYKCIYVMFICHGSNKIL